VILESNLPFPKVLKVDNKTEQVAMANQAATTIFCTMLISLYLIFKQWQQRKLIGMKITEGAESN
jgi:hypothetical protein